MVGGKGVYERGRVSSSQPAFESTLPASRGMHCMCEQTTLGARAAASRKLSSR